jgi:uncharacterized membrane protein YdjX (TVP38/TMEM64 family)
VRTARLILVVVLAAALLIVGRKTGLVESLSTDRVRELAERSGPTGVALFAALFCVGLLFHVPTLAFVAAAVLAWGRLRGGLYSYGAALIAATLSFAIVRAVGGRPLGRLTNRHARAILRRLDTQPVLTVAVLRGLFLVAPTVNYALALSSISFGSYLLGSAIGLVVSMTVTASFLGLFFK